MIGFSQLGRHGRLGNQMYQYAALLGVAARRGLEPIVPPTRVHELGRVFRLTARVGTAADFASLLIPFSDNRLGWWPDLDRIGDRTDIYGYFQSPEYFPAEDRLRFEFRFRDDLAEPAAESATELRRRFATLVGVTVRRGDYLSHTDKYCQVWSTDFYDRAMASLAGDHVGFVVSSDDPNWCRSRFDRPDVVVLDSTLSDQSQLAVLAACDHAIIANSSYAWWAAWLIDRPGKRVIAPVKWFEKNADFSDDERAPLPPGWLAF